MPAADAWIGGREPKLREILKDPIVVALMRRDSVAARDVKSALSSGLARRAAKRAVKQRLDRA